MVTTHSPGTPEYQTQLNALMQAAFGFTFSEWLRRGHWPADYTCYSIVQGGALLANAGVYRLDLLVGGRPLECYQIGAVATHPQHRGRGLSRQVLECILSQRPNAAFFLFPNETVLDFYPRFGFTLHHDRQPYLPMRLEPAQEPILEPASTSASAGASMVIRRAAADPSPVRRLTVDDPALGPYLTHRAGRSAGLSARLDCANAAPINWFHLIHTYSGCIYEIPALRALVIAEQQGPILHLVDVIALEPLTFAALRPYLAWLCAEHPRVEAIHFGFNPDWLGLTCPTTDYPDSAYFARGPFAIPENAIIPLMIRT